MPELTLVGLSEDGRSLVLSAGAEQTFTVPVDERLRAAVVSDRVRLGQLELELGATLRPKEIQSRIRSGAPVDEVAAAAGVGVERIMRYAGPVLSERQHVATQAQRSVLRRPDSTSGPKALADVVAARLQQRGLSGDAVTWDAWRRDDAKWTVTAAYRSGERERTATFVFDPPARVVVAGDDEARWLSGESGRLHGPQPRTSGPRRRTAEGSLSVVGSGESELFDQEAPDHAEGADEPVETAAFEDGPLDAAGLEDDNPTVTLAPVVDEVVTDEAVDEPRTDAEDEAEEGDGDVGLAIFGRRDEQADEDVAKAGPEDVAADEVAELDDTGNGAAPQPAQPAAAEPTRPAEAGDTAAENTTTRADDRADDRVGNGVAAPGGEAGSRSAGADDASPGSAEAATDEQPAPGVASAEVSAEEPEAEPATQRPKRRSRKRAEVPSWDDILFGTKSD